MSIRTTLLAAGAATLLATAALADGIVIHDPYARSSGPTSVTGAAFMGIENQSDTPDRLIDARGDIAARVEIHTHLQDANGVMRMVKVEDGIPIPAGGTAMLQRGGDHVMFMGLTQPLLQGDEITVTLVFENAGEVEVTIPVDLERKPGHGHGAMSSGG
ncbi:copper chaperone PCu(A)C [Aestuariivita boseongensis]|uniref:copper chaperone PCu(A)C n=1 Tax=Aestuariivita boseongensis TaxID=1470562 RepID=UPI000681A96A|nr:copper chaperone PCu(A)C [Aestuariivita boseongensis]